MDIFDTRREQAEALAAAGITGVAAEQVLAVTAGLRHERRAYRAYTVARDAVEALDLEYDSLMVTALAGAVLIADLAGVGGRLGLEGASTTRIPALAGLGKGRKQASDGEAWTAAIESATVRVRDEFDSIVIYATFDGLAIAATPAGDPTGRFSAMIPEAVVPVQWQQVLASLGLLQSLRMSSQVPRMQSRVLRWLDSDEPAAWADAVNLLAERAAQATQPPAAEAVAS